MAIHWLTICGRAVDVQVDDEPADEEFAQQVQQGWGNDEALNEARLAAEVQAMGLQEYARRRKELGPGNTNRGMFSI